jgi:excisionase family DNA binding protein
VNAKTDASVWMSTAEAARLLRVSPSTVRAYIHEARVRAEQLSTGRWRVLRDDVRRLAGLASPESTSPPASAPRRRRSPAGTCQLRGRTNPSNHPPIEMVVVWNSGPRSTAWDELWRRILREVLDADERVLGGDDSEASR